jgi:hypothetical protein
MSNVNPYTLEGLGGPNGKNAPSQLVSGTYDELLVSNVLGKYAELTRYGKVFIAKSGAAAAIPIQSTLTNSPTLWNPSTSGKFVFPLMLTINPGVIGVPVLTGLTISQLLATGETVGTGLPIATFTNITPVPALLGRGTCVTKFANATVTFTTNPTLIADLGIVHWLEGTAAEGVLQAVSFDFDGLICMPPGTSISIGAIAATSTTFWTTIYFAELPVGYLP